MRRILVRYGLPDCQPQVRQEWQAGGREDPPLYHQLRPEGRSRERPDHGAGASPWLAVLQGQLPRSSRHRLHPPGRSQQCREHPRPHRHRQLACPHRGTAALHGQAVRLGSGQEAPLHLCHAPAPPCRCHGDVRASRPEPDQSAGSPRRPCFGARVLGAAARTTPPRPCQRQTCRRRAAAHPDRLPDRAGQAAKADLRCAEQDHHLRGIFCIAHAGTRHRREGESRPVELLPARPDKVHHHQEIEQEVLKIITADQILILCKIYSRFGCTLDTGICSCYNVTYSRHSRSFVHESKRN